MLNKKFETFLSEFIEKFRIYISVLKVPLQESRAVRCDINNPLQFALLPT